MLDLLTALYCRISGRLTRQDGQALTEYALILALVALVTVVALELLGGGIKAILTGAAPHS
ncbi:MAG: Flp family type IVb pilin [Solirubrobacteraceae bacterium]